MCGGVVVVVFVDVVIGSVGWCFVVDVMLLISNQRARTSCLAVPCLCCVPVLRASWRSPKRHRVEIDLGQYLRASGRWRMMSFALPLLLALSCGVSKSWTGTFFQWNKLKKNLDRQKKKKRLNAALFAAPLAKAHPLSQM